MTVRTWGAPRQRARGRIAERSQRDGELTMRVPADRRVARTGGPVRGLAAAPSGSAVDAGAGPGAPRLSKSAGLQAGAAAASGGPGSAVPASVLAGIWTLRRQSRSMACVPASLSQHRNSSSTFILSTGCRTLPGGISTAGALRPEEPLCPARRPDARNATQARLDVCGADEGRRRGHGPRSPGNGGPGRRQVCRPGS